MSPTWQAYPGSGKAGKPHRLKLTIQNFIILLYNLPMMIDKYMCSKCYIEKYVYEIRFIKFCL